jgi:integrase
MPNFAPLREDKLAIHCKSGDTISLQARWAEAGRGFLSSQSSQSAVEGTMKFTIKSIDDLELPPGKRDHFEWDDVISGWGFRLRDGGKRVWVFQYAIGAGEKKRTRRITFGAYPAMDVPTARAQAAQYHAQVMAGGDPAIDKAESKAQPIETFEACMRVYLERRRRDVKLRPRSYAEIERHLVRNLKALHGLPIDKVDRRAIAVELGRLTDNGPTQANRTRTSVVKFLNWCAGEGLIDANPALFTNRNSEGSRDRVLTTNELAAVWHALPEGDYGDIVRLLILLGQRTSEIADLRWDEVDLERGIITLPPARVKNRRRHTIPLAAPATAILKARRQSNGRDLIFGIGTGQRGFGGWTKSKARLDAKVKIPAWVHHDLRRSAATGMAELGISPWAIEAVLNHATGNRTSIGSIYNKSTYENEKTAALMRWAEHLMGAIEGRTDVVTPLKRA